MQQAGLVSAKVLLCAGKAHLVNESPGRSSSEKLTLDACCELARLLRSFNAQSTLFLFICAHNKVEHGAEMTATRTSDGSESAISIRSHASDAQTFIKRRAKV
jgi:hypothetical protein